MEKIDDIRQSKYGLQCPTNYTLSYYPGNSKKSPLDHYLYLPWCPVEARPGILTVHYPRLNCRQIFKFRTKCFVKNGYTSTNQLQVHWPRTLPNGHQHIHRISNHMAPMFIKFNWSPCDISSGLYQVWSVWTVLEYKLYEPSRTSRGNVLSMSWLILLHDYTPVAN